MDGTSFEENIRVRVCDLKVPGKETRGGEGQKNGVGSGWWERAVLRVSFGTEYATCSYSYYVEQHRSE